MKNKSFLWGDVQQNRDLNQADLQMKEVYFAGKVIKNTL